MSTVSREKGEIFCLEHLKKKLVFLCKQCNILICNTCIVKEHSGHSVEEVAEVVEKKFGKLDDFITKIEEKTIPKVETIVKQVEAQTSARKKELEAGIEKAYQHEKSLIEILRENTKKTVDELKGELQTVDQQFHRFKSESDKYLEDIKSALNECKETKKTENDILIIDVVNSVGTLHNNPPTCQILQTRKIFTPGSNPVFDIEKAYGCVCTDGEVIVEFQYSEDKPTPVRRRPKPIPRPRPSTGAEAAPIKRRQLLSEPLVTPCNLQSKYPNSIEKFSDGTLCYCCLSEYCVYLIDKDNTTCIKEVKLDVNVLDIAIHPTTDVLYIGCYCDKSIRTVDIRTGTTSTVFNTVDIPYCMTFNGDGTILVGFCLQNKVVNCTLSGEELKSITVEQPWHISLCNITGNILIASHSSDTPVMNKDFQTMFIYNGPTEKGQTKKAVRCFDAVFDTEGHILVGDYDNSVVYVVDANTGKCISTINLEGFGHIQCLCLNQNGEIVVGTNSPNKLVFVKYLS